MSDMFYLPAGTIPPIVDICGPVQTLPSFTDVAELSRVVVSFQDENDFEFRYQLYDALKLRSQISLPWSRDHAFFTDSPTELKNYSCFIDAPTELPVDKLENLELTLPDKQVRLGDIASVGVQQNVKVIFNRYKY